MNSLRAGPGLSILIVFRRAQLILLEDTTWVRHLKDRGRGMMSRLWLERARARRPPFLRSSYVKGRQTIETLMYCTCRVIAPKTQRKNSSARCSLETSGFLDEEWRANGVTSSAHHGGGIFKFAAQPDISKAFRVRHLLIGLLCATRRALAHGAQGMLNREGSHRGGGSAHATLASGRVGFVASGCVKVPAEVLRRPPGCPAFPVMPGRAKGRIPESQLDYAVSHMPSLRV
ncbi:hypothetical protein BJV77DRAFT_454816 [Russula vinacea]|nr:hypothetical protein BJV77DRAFT_454816 [Russula vinacea]